MSTLWHCTDPRVPPLASKWFPGCAWHWAAAMPDGHRVAIVSSRTPRVIDPHASWLAGLRCAVAKVHRERSVVVAGHRTTCELLLRRAARRVGLNFVLLHESADEVLAAKLPPLAIGDVRGWPIRPHAPSSADRDPDEISHVPDRDRAAIAWADEVIALGIRSRGNLHQILRARLQAGASSVLLADWPGLQPQDVREELLALGACLWSPDSATVDSRTDIEPASTDGLPAASMAPSNSESRFRPPPSSAGWDYLTHTTRACPGAWPGQSSDDYHDSLLDCRGDSEHSALGTLIRIAGQRRLIASSRLIRGGHAVVSLTAVPLVELPALHRFREHLSRWDFEPFGLCLRRGWLAQRGTRPVLYGGEAEWTVTPAADRPFFQIVRELDRATWSGGAPTATIVWTAEREWRHIGDLDLSDADGDDVLAFVPTRADARRLSQVCPWPIVVLDMCPGD